MQNLSVSCIGPKAGCGMPCHFSCQRKPPYPVLLKKSGHMFDFGDGLVQSDLHNWIHLCGKCRNECSDHSFMHIHHNRALINTLIHIFKWDLKLQLPCLSVLEQCICFHFTLYLAWSLVLSADIEMLMWNYGMKFCCTLWKYWKSQNSFNGAHGRDCNQNFTLVMWCWDCGQNTVTARWGKAPALLLPLKVQDEKGNTALLPQAEE